MSEAAALITPAGIAPGFLSTRGNQIVDSTGTPVRLTGINWFGMEGTAYAPQGLWVDSYQNHMKRMQELGFNVIRLPFSDDALHPGATPTIIDYRLNPDLLGLTPLGIMDRIIAYAGEIGMRVILDHHLNSTGNAGVNPDGLWYDARHPEAGMIANWTMLADRYKGNPAVIGADLHNEPHGPATWGDGNPATDWAAAAGRIGNAIQAVNPDWLIIVQGIAGTGEQSYWWGGNLTGVREHPVTLNVPGKLVYSPHDYPPSLYAMPWFSDPAFPDNMPAKWTDTWGYIFAEGLAPVLVGEFGTRHETAADRNWLEALLRYQNGDLDGDGAPDLRPGDQGISWTYWSWNPTSWDTGGILADDWTTVNQDKAAALQAGQYGGAYTVRGTAGDDHILIRTGPHAIDGGAGLDTLRLSFAAADCGVAHGAGRVELFTPGGTNTLRNVERIQFTDGLLVIDPADPAFAVHRLYQASLGRAADREGLTAWTHAHSTGLPMEEMARQFMASPEFQGRFGTPDTPQFVALLYRNVLGRDGDPAERSAWTHALASGEASREQVLLSFAGSAENIHLTSSRVDSGLWLL